MSGPKCSDENQTRKAAGYCPGPLVSPKYTSNKLVWKKEKTGQMLVFCPYALFPFLWRFGRRRRRRRRKVQEVSVCIGRCRPFRRYVLVEEIFMRRNKFRVRSSGGNTSSLRPFVFVLFCVRWMDDGGGGPGKRTRLSR